MNFIRIYQSKLRAATAADEIHITNLLFKNAAVCVALPIEASAPLPSITTVPGVVAQQTAHRSHTDYGRQALQHADSTLLPLCALAAVWSVTMPVDPIPGRAWQVARSRRCGPTRAREGGHPRPSVRWLLCVCVGHQALCGAPAHKLRTGLFP